MRLMLIEIFFLIYLILKKVPDVFQPRREVEKNKFQHDETRKHIVKIKGKPLHQ